jgi:hypothetical protein
VGLPTWSNGELAMLKSLPQSVRYLPEEVNMKIFFLCLGVFILMLLGYLLLVTKEAMLTNNAACQLEDSNVGIVYQKINQ